MSQFRFLSLDGKDVAPKEWLHMWADLYPSQDYAGYEELMTRHESFSHADIERIGRWKDNAKTADKWKPNVASVAYEIWMQAVSEVPVCPKDDRIADFLEDWSGRKYTDEFGTRRVEKRFGLSRVTTLLHFISGGRFPIFDSRVRKAMARLLSSHVPKTVRWYLDSYCTLLSEIAAVCTTKDLRVVHKALFSYGGRTFTESE